MNPETGDPIKADGPTAKALRAAGISPVKADKWKKYAKGAAATGLGAGLGGLAYKYRDRLRRSRRDPDRPPGGGGDPDRQPGGGGNSDQQPGGDDSALLIDNDGTFGGGNRQFGA